MSKTCIPFVEEEQNKTRNYYFGAYFSNVPARCSYGKYWPHVPVLLREAGGSCPAVILILLVVGGGAAAKKCFPGVQVGSEELGEIP